MVRSQFRNDSKVKKSISYLRMNSRLDLTRVKTVSFGIQCAAFLSSSFWHTVPNEAKNSTTINNFKSFIKHWKGQENAPVGCANFTLCKFVS